MTSYQIALKTNIKIFKNLIRLKIALNILYILYKNKTNSQTKNIANNYQFYLKFLNNNKQANLLNNNATCAQLRSCCIIYFEKNKKVQKEIKCKTKIYTRKNIKTNYKNI